MADQAEDPGEAVRVVVASDDDPPGTRRISVSGEVDLSSCGPLRRALDQVIDGGAARIELDVGGLGFIDSTGLWVLVSALKRMQSTGGAIVLTSPGPSMQRVLEITGLSALFGLA